MKALATILLASTVLMASPVRADAAPDVTPARECAPLARDKPAVKVKLKPDSALMDLMNMYGMLTCKKLKVTADLSKARISFATTTPISLEELSRTLRDATGKAGFQYEETDTAVFVRP